ncbi:unnamed protein product [Lactuca virosa]|uniref:Cytochrome b5 heme-binding domain-containing protein n=1 Tax=Lactuca virosa TaxID=75947 RepID=A0AAU9MUT5_9ASTR|nr:unnamed protein product [Lactuca virosa]
MVASDEDITPLMEKTVDWKRRFKEVVGVNENHEFMVEEIKMCLIVSSEVATIDFELSTLAQRRALNSSTNKAVTTHYLVYDVAPFMEDHPGGDEVLLAETGKDTTSDFEDVGHSDDAQGMIDKYYIVRIWDSNVNSNFNSNVNSLKQCPIMWKTMFVRIVHYTNILIFVKVFALKPSSYPTYLDPRALNQLSSTTRQMKR